MAPGLDEETIKLTVHQDTLAIEGTLAFPAPDGAHVIENPREIQVKVTSGDTR